MRLAIIAMKQHHAQDALPMAERAVQLAPESALAHEILGRILSDLGRQRRQPGNLKPRKNLNPRSRILILKSPGHMPTPQFPGRGREVPTPQPSTSSRDKQQRRGSRVELTTRSATMRVRSRVNPQWDKGWADLGTLYHTTGKFPQAVAALKNSIAINRRIPQAWAFLGLTEFETKDYSNAYVHLERARELDFRGTPAVMLLAIYHLAEVTGT